MTHTYTKTILEPGKLYRTTHTVDLNNPKEGQRKSEYWDADRACTVPKNEILFAVENEFEPEHGAWVLFGKAKYWLCGSYFQYLERIHTKDKIRK